MEQLELKAKPRTIFGKNVKNLRNKGIIPAVLYGKKFKNINLELDKIDFEKLFSQAGSSTLVDLNTDDKNKIKILIHEPQRNPVTDEIIHVDLYKVDMAQEIHTEIPLNFIGASAAVDDLEGNLITSKDTLEIECLPQNLISEIEVDISALKTFDDLIKVGDLKIPATIKVLSDENEIIAQVTPPRSDEELEEMESEAAADSEKAQIENIEATAEAEKAAKEEATEGSEGDVEKTPEPNENK